MNRAALVKATSASLSAALFAAVFFAVIHEAEKADDIGQRAAALNAEMDDTEALMQRAAAALCRAELWPGAQVLWTWEGDLVCRPAVMTAQTAGGQP